MKRIKIDKLHLTHVSTSACFDSYNYKCNILLKTKYAKIQSDYVTSFRVIKNERGYISKKN